MLDRTYNSTPTRGVIDKIKIGIGTTNPTVADTALGHQVPITGTESVDTCEAADWTDSADMTTALNSTTYKQGNNSLNLTKDGTGSATASTYKTTTSRDFTSKELSIWLYIKDSTALGKLATSNCITIRFGSDASNYYEWQKSSSDVTTGWNLIDVLTSSNADSTTGSPTITACDYTYVALTADAAATTWSDGDFMMDDIKVVSADDYEKAFESGYPDLDYTNIQCEVRARITTVQANGYAISEAGVFNDDGPDLLESRGTFSAISKSTSDEIIIIFKTQIE